MKRYLVESAAIRQNLETLKKRAGKATENFPARFFCVRFCFLLVQN